MTASLLLTLLSASPAPVLHARGPCAAQVRGALERVRPGTSVVIGGSVVEQDLEVMVDHQDSGWRLTVSGSDGTLRLERALGDSQIPCEVVSDVAAEMVERFFHTQLGLCRTRANDCLGLNETRTPAEISLTLTWHQRVIRAGD